MILALSANCGAIETPFLPGGAFSPGPADVFPRYFHHASRLDDGRVLITGGLTARVIPPALIVADTIACYDPESNRMSGGVGKFSRSDAAVAKLQIARSSHTQTTIAHHRLLVTGGNTRADNNQPNTPTATTELVDTETGSVVFGATMSEPRGYHTATPISPSTILEDVMPPIGESTTNEADAVVIAGGSSWQIFDAETNQLSAPISLVRRRTRHAAVRIETTEAAPAVQVLIIGGAESGDSMEILNPIQGTSTLLDVRLPTGVFDLAAIVLRDGRVLIFGGQKTGTGETTNQTVVFDPAVMTLTRLDPPPNLEHGMGDHRLVRVGRYVLAFGGEQQIGKSDTELRKMYVFDGESLSWVNEVDMLHTHDDFPAVPLLNGRILIIGGGTGVLGIEAPTADTEFFTPQNLSDD